MFQHSCAFEMKTWDMGHRSGLTEGNFLRHHYYLFVLISSEMIGDITIRLQLGLL